MRYIVALCMAFLFSLATLWAGPKNNRSQIRVRLSDGSPLTVTINGRDYKKIGRSIVIADIPGKRQQLQVYKIRPYADGKGAKAELVFSGTIKLEKGNSYEAMVDIGQRRVRLQKVSAFRAVPGPLPFDPKGGKTLPENETFQEMDEPIWNGEHRALSPALEKLKKDMDQLDEDGKKLQAAKRYLRSGPYTTQDVASITDWIFFDDNKLLFVKDAYKGVSDKENYKQLADLFTLQSARGDFENFLKSAPAK